MLNQCILVGKIKEFIDVEGGVDIIISIPRNIIGEDGILIVDNIKVNLWDNIAKNVKEYCKVGDLVGVKARIEVDTGTIKIKADKVTFLSSKKEDTTE